MDGSTLGIEEKRHSGYAVIDGDSCSVCERDRLPNSWPAQTSGLHLLNWALKLLESQEGNIRVHLQDTYGVVHTSGKMWTERGLFNSKGKNDSQRNDYTGAKGSHLLSAEMAMFHVNGH